MKLSPTNKVTGSLAGAPLAVVLIWLAELGGVSLPQDVALSICALSSFVVSWLVNDRA